MSNAMKLTDAELTAIRERDVLRLVPDTAGLDRRALLAHIEALCRELVEARRMLALDTEMVNEQAAELAAVHKALDENWVMHQRVVTAETRIAELEAENERLLSLVCQWSENCTGRHGSQSQCVEAGSALDRGAEHG